MCGIAGFSRTDPTAIPHGARFARALALGIESRGKHATGFGWAQQGDDENAWYAKKPGPASQVVNSLPLPQRGIHNLLAHTRHFTKGSPKVYENNHPVVHEHIVAVHNGRVDNDDELIGLAGVERVGKVDSFALPAVLGSQETIGFDHPVEMLEMVEGVAALAWIDAFDINAIHLARLSTRPLVWGKTRRGDFVFSSTKSTLAKASKMAKQIITEVHEVEEGTYLRVEAGDITDVMRFDVRHPVKAVAEDMPGASNVVPIRGQYRLPVFDADDTEWWKRYDEMKNAERDAVMGDYDPDADGIDWENVLPRRGWRMDEDIDAHLI